MTKEHLECSVKRLFSGVKSVLPGPGRSVPARELPSYPPPVDPCGATSAGGQLSHQPELCTSAKVCGSQTLLSPGLGPPTMQESDVCASWGRCRVLNMHRNHLGCFRQLPKLPAVEHLCLSENAIGSLGGLGALGSSPLRSLTLTHNPVTFTQDYRAR